MNLLLDGRRILFEHFIDYAGLLPPASLSLDEAVTRFRAARTGPHGWVLGLFMCPSSRLEDLAAYLTATMIPGEAPWQVGVVFDEPLGKAAMHASVFDRYMDPAATLVSVELGADSAADLGPSNSLVAVATAAGGISPSVLPFLPVSGTVGVDGMTETVIAIDRLREAQLRIIGATLPDADAASPPASAIAQIIELCQGRSVPFKVGAHRTITSFEAGVMHHGLLNLLAATALSNAGAPEAEVIEVIEETNSDAFEIGAVGLRHRDRYASTPSLRDARRLFRSVTGRGFDELVSDLNALHLLNPPSL